MDRDATPEKVLFPNVFRAKSYTQISELDRAPSLMVKANKLPSGEISGN